MKNHVPNVNQFCEYAIDSKWILVNPTHKIKIRTEIKAITKSEIHTKQFYQKKEINFLYTRKRPGKFYWKDIDFAKRIIKVAQAEMQDTKFDSNGNIVERTTIVSGTKTACSVRVVPMTDIVLLGKKNNISIRLM